MKALEFHPEAEEDLDEAIDFYEGKQHGLGRRLAGEVRDVIQRLRSGGVWWFTLVAEHAITSRKEIFLRNRISRT